MITVINGQKLSERRYIVSTSGNHKFGGGMIKRILKNKCELTWLLE